jgi:hypothetical protein
MQHLFCVLLIHLVSNLLSKLVRIYLSLSTLK